MNETRISFNKLNLTFLLLGCIALIVPMFHAIINDKQLSILIFLGSFALVLIFISIIIIARLLDRGPALILDSYGLTNRTETSKGQFIPWENVSSVEIVKLKYTRQLNIYLKDEKSIIDAETGIKRLLLKCNMFLYKTPVVLSGPVIKCDIFRLEMMIRDYANI